MGTPGSELSQGALAAQPRTPKSWSLPRTDSQATWVINFEWECSGDRGHSRQQSKVKTLSPKMIFLLANCTFSKRQNLIFQGDRENTLSLGEVTIDLFWGAKFCNSILSVKCFPIVGWEVWREQVFGGGWWGWEGVGHGHRFSPHYNIVQGWSSYRLHVHHRGSSLEKICFL